MTTGKPEDIPQVVWNTGAKMAGEYFAWLNAGNSTGYLSEHAVAAMADTIARAILAAKAEERHGCLHLVEDYTSHPNELAAFIAAEIVEAIRKRGGE